MIGDGDEGKAQLLSDLRSLLVEKGVVDLQQTNGGSKPELRLTPKYESMARSGINSSMIANTIRTAVTGTTVAYHQEYDERIPIRVMVGKEDQNFEDPLRGLLVRNQLGALLPISEFVTVNQIESLKKIEHYNGVRSIKFEGNVRPETTPSALSGALKQPLAELFAKYPDYTYELGGEAEKASEVLGKILWLIGAALMGVYLLLVIQFNSLSQPIMVILAVPFGLVGIALAFSLQGMETSLLAMVGIIGFVGVVVNDSLIMVHLINRIRDETLSKGSMQERYQSFVDAVIAGATERFRPIVLTTVTTVAGLFPTAYGLIGGLESFISPMVMAMTWGLLIGTPAVLYIIPVLYTVQAGFLTRGR